MLITHVVLGYPSIADTEKIIDAMVEHGVKKIELQIPFSDPIADGPTISNANARSLEAGMTVKKSFELAKKMCQKYPAVHFYFMTYGNILFNYGIEKFCIDSKNIGIHGFIIPDFPLESLEGIELQKYAQENDIANVMVVSPGMNEDRIKKYLQLQKDFIYLTSTKGSTGQRTSLSQTFKQHINFLRRYSEAEIGIGFGISKREHVEDVLSVADYAIVGSYVIKSFEQTGIDGVKEALGNLL